MLQCVVRWNIADVSKHLRGFMFRILSSFDCFTPKIQERRFVLDVQKCHLKETVLRPRRLECPQRDPKRLLQKKMLFQKVTLRRLLIIKCHIFRAESQKDPSKTQRENIEFCLLPDVKHKYVLAKHAEILYHFPVRAKNCEKRLLASSCLSVCPSIVCPSA